jgi:hypothetical protein
MMNIIELANGSGLVYYGMGKDRAKFIHHLEAFAALVAAHEREECAKIADEWDKVNKLSNYGGIIAIQIRARGTT